MGRVLSQASFVWRDNAESRYIATLEPRQLGRSFGRQIARETAEIRGRRFYRQHREPPRFLRACRTFVGNPKDCDRENQRCRHCQPQPARTRWVKGLPNLASVLESSCRIWVKASRQDAIPLWVYGWWLAPQPFFQGNLRPERPTPDGEFAQYYAKRIHIRS